MSTDCAVRRLVFKEENHTPEEMAANAEYFRLRLAASRIIYRPNLPLADIIGDIYGNGYSYHALSLFYRNKVGEVVVDYVSKENIDLAFCRCLVAFAATRPGLKYPEVAQSIGLMRISDAQVQARWDEINFRDYTYKELTSLIYDQYHEVPEGVHPSLRMIYSAYMQSLLLLKAKHDQRPNGDREALIEIYQEALSSVAKHPGCLAKELQGLTNQASFDPLIRGRRRHPGLNDEELQLKLRQELRQASMDEFLESAKNYCKKLDKKYKQYLEVQALAEKGPIPDLAYQVTLGGMVDEDMEIPYGRKHGDTKYTSAAVCHDIVTKLMKSKLLDQIRALPKEKQLAAIEYKIESILAHYGMGERKPVNKTQTYKAHRDFWIKKLESDQ